MRGTIAFLWAVGLGWYIRASGLDEDLVKLGRDCYDLTVLHTADVLRRAQVEQRDHEAVPA